MSFGCVPLIVISVLRDCTYCTLERCRSGLCRYRTRTVQWLSGELLSRFWIAESDTRGFQLYCMFLACYSWTGCVPSSPAYCLTKLNETLLLQWKQIRKPKLLAILLQLNLVRFQLPLLVNFRGRTGPEHSFLAVETINLQFSSYVLGRAVALKETLYLLVA